jgi:two-component system, NtrC family, response regulator HydG
MTRALVVEDESVLRLTFGQFLRDEGYEVESAEDYDGALACIGASKFDVIITDIIMSGKTGVDLLRTVRERELATPVIMITGEPNVASAAEAVRLGAFDYLSKPVTRDALLRVARLATDQKRLAEERDHYAAQMDVYRQELEAIFNSVNEGVVTVDARMYVRQVNAAGGRILGISPEGARGKPFADLLPGQLTVAEQALEDTLRSGEAMVDRRFELWSGEEREQILMASTAPLTGECVPCTGAVLGIRDMTRLVRLERQVEDSLHYRNMIGKSAPMRAVFELIQQVAETDTTVLVRGESGTGKELVAAALHQASARAEGPFLRVNCAALHENLLESELFGHVKGSFTGAVKDRVGRFEAANGGTILLDEIGDISPRLQLRLLRVLQEREFERVGDSTSVPTDVRVIASTNQDLEHRISQGEFRQDLYYRLNVVRIDLPPLHDRLEDIPLLLDDFRRRFNRTLKKEITGVSEGAMHILMQYAWPGNVRELENCVERAFVVCRDSVIQPGHLPAEFRAGTPAFSIPGGFPAKRVERTGLVPERIIEVLGQTDWNVAKAARVLSIARNTLYQRMKTANIVRPAR